MDKVTQCYTMTIMHSDVHNTNNRSKHTYNSSCCQAPYFSVINCSATCWTLGTTEVLCMHFYYTLQ